MPHCEICTTEGQEDAAGNEATDREEEMDRGGPEIVTGCLVQDTTYEFPI